MMVDKMVELLVDVTDYVTAAKKVDEMVYEMVAVKVGNWVEMKAVATVVLSVDALVGKMVDVMAAL